MAVKHELGQSILDTQLADPNVGVKHWKTLQANYARTPGFQRWKDELHAILHQQYLNARRDRDRFDGVDDRQVGNQ